MYQLISVADHHSSTSRQVLKDDIEQVAAVISTEFTRSTNFTIRHFAVSNCKYHECITLVAPQILSD